MDLKTFIPCGHNSTPDSPIIRAMVGDRENDFSTLLGQHTESDALKVINQLLMYYRWYSDRIPLKYVYSLIDVAYGTTGTSPRFDRQTTLWAAINTRSCPISISIRILERWKTIPKWLHKKATESDRLELVSMANELANN